MEANYSRAALMRFFGYLAEKGLMNANTIAARKAAANQVLSVLDDSEAIDLRNINLDTVSNRFVNLNPNKFTPNSLSTYQSRLKSGIEDFVRYTDNPASFKTEASKPRTATVRTENVKKNGGEILSDRRDENGLGRSHPIDTSLPIQIRDGVIVRISGVPADLSKKEAQRVANVILALALIDDE